jgi:hypothetical protein
MLAPRRESAEDAEIAARWATLTTSRASALFRISRRRSHRRTGGRLLNALGAATRPRRSGSGDRVLEQSLQGRSIRSRPEASLKTQIPSDPTLNSTFNFSYSALGGAPASFRCRLVYGPSRERPMARRLQPNSLDSLWRAESSSLFPFSIGGYHTGVDARLFEPHLSPFIRQGCKEVRACTLEVHWFFSGPFLGGAAWRKTGLRATNGRHGCRAPE